MAGVRRFRLLNGFLGATWTVDFAGTDEKVAEGCVNPLMAGPALAEAARFLNDNLGHALIVRISQFTWRLPSRVNTWIMGAEPQRLLLVYNRRMSAKSDCCMAENLNGLSFRPLPFLANPHVQTLLAHLMPAPRVRFPIRLRTVALPDGDRLAVHDSVPSGWRNGDAIVLLVHGLGGCHRSGYMLRLAAHFLKHGLRVLRLDLRGIGAGAALARMTYHGGCSGDVRAAALDIHEDSPASPLVLLGLSLGGNLVLKLAGEACHDPVPGLYAVAAVAPPIDLTLCAAMLARLPLYDAYFARQLVKQVRQHQRHFPDVALPRFPRRPTMLQFDELCTAPRWGFAHALDYYQRASALHVLENVRVPSFILTARDDPFIAVEPFESLAMPPNMEVHIAAHGGHLGFLGNDGAGGFRWAERRVADWVLRRLAFVRTCRDYEPAKPTSP